MNLKTYLKSSGITPVPEDAAFARFAKDCGYTASTFYMFVLGHKKPSAQGAIRISNKTNGKVSRKAIKPEFDWNLFHSAG